MEITNSGWFIRFHKSVNSLSSWFEWVGLIAIVLIVIAALIDVIGSKLLHWPLPGSTELTGVIQVAAIAGGLAYSKIDGRHIRVDILVDKLPGKSKPALEIFISLLGLALWVIAGLMTFKLGLRQLSNTTETLLLGIPLYPFALWAGIACFIMCLVIIIELLSFIEKVQK